MVFVHARKETVRTAEAIRDLAMKAGVSDELRCDGPDSPSKEAFEQYDKQIQKSRNAELRELYASGFGIHHAGTATWPKPVPLLLLGTPHCHHHNHPQFSPPPSVSLANSQGCCARTVLLSNARLPPAP